MKKKEKKGGNGYFTATGIIMALLSMCVLLNYNNDQFGNPILIFVIPGILGLIGGISQLLHSKSKVFILVTTVCFYALTIINFIGVKDLSLLGILAIILGSINIRKYLDLKDL